MFKAIPYENISTYKDPISLFNEDGVVLVRDKEKGKVNPITIGWGSIGVLWGKPCCTIFIHESRYSKHLLDEEDFFSVCFLPKEQKKMVAYFGKFSGRDVDKIKESGLEVVDGDYPFLKDSELVIFCKKVGQTKFDESKISLPDIKNWCQQSGVHSIYFGEIVKVIVRDEK
ncbi:MAG: flavin reductase family protein [Bacilli bacterium]|nr:flavin reductase family protein [Bacilli bacterium]